MKTIHFFTPVLFLFSIQVNAQIVSEGIPCSDAKIKARHLVDDPNALTEIEANEKFTQKFIENLILHGRNSRSHDSTAQYVIPVVLHVFHNGDDGKITYEQAQSGMDILNSDFLGLNPDWDDVDPAFDAVKSSLDIQFCLASIDPDGNPTTGVNYYEDSLAMLNEVDLFDYAWDNFSYLNIYLPKYTGGEPSLFTAYAYYPSITRVENNLDGIFYSSIRWGYGDHSELEDGQEWASVGTHETGHWLNLLHTFENGCSAPGDYVSDTPPTLGGTIELDGCFNYDESCGVSTNGENYMDYNHDCKKMFTQGQVDRMTAALNLPARNNLWSEENLFATGCKESFVSMPKNNIHEVFVYPNPATNLVRFSFNQMPSRIIVFNSVGEVIADEKLDDLTFELNTHSYGKGVYIYQVNFENGTIQNKLIIQ